MYLVRQSKTITVHDWEHLLSLFNAKFFYADAKFSSAELGCIQQHSGEDLYKYVKKFHDKDLDYCDPVEEECFPMVISMVC